ncbi:hypothetical protein TNCV_2801801 [Trichonephila clavipes]|nr:hypothetical protein TNCV_2801801 [Trichonephila clavipes]
MLRGWFSIFFLELCKLTQYVAVLTVVFLGSYYHSSGPSTLKKHVNKPLPALVDESAFFGLGVKSVAIPCSCLWRQDESDDTYFLNVNDP